MYLDAVRQCRHSMSGYLNQTCLCGRIENHCGWLLQPQNSNTLAPWKKSYDQHREHIKKQRHHFDNKGLYSQSYDFSCSHVWI